jgi:hypothetical protein
MRYNARMIFPSNDYELLREESPPPAGSYVALGCPHPDCKWVSQHSRVLDDPRPNETFLALRTVEDEWDQHWVDHHQPRPIKLVAKDGA